MCGCARECVHIQNVIRIHSNKTVYNAVKYTHKSACADSHESAGRSPCCQGRGEGRGWGGRLAKLLPNTVLYTISREIHCYCHNKIISKPQVCILTIMRSIQLPQECFLDPGPLAMNDTTGTELWLVSVVYTYQCFGDHIRHCYPKCVY